MQLQMAFSITPYTSSFRLILGCCRSGRTVCCHFSSVRFAYVSLPTNLTTYAGHLGPMPYMACNMHRSRLRPEDHACWHHF